MCIRDRCYYCGACVMACPHDGAIRLEHPLMNRAKFVPVRYPEEMCIRDRFCGVPTNPITSSSIFFKSATSTEEALFLEIHKRPRIG